MKLPFEEKTYEAYFGQELGRLTNITYSPGQVAEGYLGFDGAAYLSAALIHDALGFISLVPTQLSKGWSLQDIESFARSMDSALPEFKLNFFVQYKRPEYITRSNGKEWGHWKRSYFRYKLVEHQQMALERIDRRAGGKAAVAYASPTFWQATDLYKFAQDRKVIQNSNIVGADRLIGHTRFTYVDEDGGVALSDPERLEAISLQRT